MIGNYSRLRWTSPLLAACVVLVLFAVPCRAATVTLDFVGLPCESSFSGTHLGYTFNSAWSTECNGDYASSWGNAVPGDLASSGAAAGNNYIDPSLVPTITRAQPFNLLGGSASSFLIGDAFDVFLSSQLLEIDGYLGATLVGSITMDFSSLAAGYSAITGSLLGVNSLVFNTSGFPLTNAWLVDHLELSDAAMPEVPEPSSLLLSATALALTGVAVKRRRRKTR
jgi:hypothetical protein